MTTRTLTTPTAVPAPSIDVAASTAAETVAAAFSAVRKLPFAEQVEYLLGSVGPRITAAGAGLRDARQLATWRKGEAPREELRLDKVAALAEIAASVMAVYPAAVAASFLRSSQPALDDDSPLLLIRDAAQEEDLIEVMGRVRGALRAFLDG